MNTKQLHAELKPRGSSDVTYLGRTVDEMIYEFMRKNEIPGLTLAIVQAPYIPRVVGYGLSDEKQRRLASANTMWPVGPISQAFAAVALMQLYEQGKLDVNASASEYIEDLPQSFKGITVLTLLRHASGIADYRKADGWNMTVEYSFDELLALVKDEPLHFEAGTDVEQSATNFLLLTEIIERVSGESYHDFVKKNQIDFLGLRRTGFAEDLSEFYAEDIETTENTQSFQS